MLFIAGHPDWARVPGFLRTVAEWAGSSRAAGTDTPSVMVNHLVKGEVHYAIVHRLPDSFRPHAPKLDREELAQTAGTFREMAHQGASRRKLADRGADRSGHIPRNPFRIGNRLGPCDAVPALPDPRVSPDPAMSFRSSGAKSRP